MAHKVCKYRLNADGTIPEFLSFDNASIHGVCLVTDNLEASPRDNLMIGITDADSTGDFSAFVDKNALQSYITSISGSWTQDAPTEDDPFATEAFDPAAEATRIWNALTALNS